MDTVDSPDDLDSLDEVQAIRGAAGKLGEEAVREAELLERYDVEQRRLGCYRLSLFGNQQCNLACRYCFSRIAPPNPSEGQLTLELIDHSIDLVVRGAPHISRLDIEFNLGGEPLLQFGLFQKTVELVRRKAAESGVAMNLGFPTNALLLHEQVIDWLEHNHRLLGVSIDGGPAVQDDLRRQPDGRGSYDHVASRIRALLRRRWEMPPGASVVLTAAHPDVYGNFLALWDLGFRVILTKPVRGPESSPYVLGYDVLPEVFRHYLRFCNFLLGRLENNDLGPLRAILSSYDYFGRFLIRVLLGLLAPYRCGGSQFSFSIRNDGTIYPCCDSMASQRWESLGNVSEITFSQIRSTSLVRRVDRISQCRSCWGRYFCGGPCVYLARLNRGSFEAAWDPDCHMILFLIRLGCYFWSRAVGVLGIALLRDVLSFVSSQGSNRTTPFVRWANPGWIPAELGFDGLDAESAYNPQFEDSAGPDVLGKRPAIGN